jgi:hypothetical protein
LATSDAFFKGDIIMKVSEWVKPAMLGVVGGAIAAIVIGFSWGGWITGGSATKMAAASADSAVVQAFTPLCIAKAEQAPAQLALLDKPWQRHEFVVEAGWVDNVNEKYRRDVARACATAVMEAMEAE